MNELERFYRARIQRRWRKLRARFHVRTIRRHWTRICWALFGVCRVKRGRFFTYQHRIWD